MGINTLQLLAYNDEVQSILIASVSCLTIIKEEEIIVRQMVKTS